MNLKQAIDEGTREAQEMHLRKQREIEEMDEMRHMLDDADALETQFQESFTREEVELALDRVESIISIMILPKEELRAMKESVHLMRSYLKL